MRITPAPRIMAITGFAPTVRVIANFAYQHMKAAITFRDQAKVLQAAGVGINDNETFTVVRSYVSGCIMSAVASLEALINELFIAEHSKLHATIPDFEKEFWRGIERKQILEKYQRALRLLDKPSFDTHTGAFREVFLLVELRNSLVHFKPAWDSKHRRRIDFQKEFSGKFSLSPFVDQRYDFVTEQ